jgi:hypothetical protein
MDLLSSMLDATLAWAGAAAILGIGVWMVVHAAIPSETSSVEPVSRRESGLRQAA